MIALDRPRIRDLAARGRVEVVIAVMAAAVLAAVSAHIPARSGERSLGGLGYGLLVAAGLAVGGCRRWPRAAVVIITVVLCVFIMRDYPDGPVWLTGLVVLAVLSWRTNRRTSIGLALLMLASLTVTAVAAGQLGIEVSAIFLGWMAAAVFLGEAVRSRRSYLSGLADRARFAERSREEETGRRVAQERLRIARDLHDSVAHAMATINVQAGAAAHVLDRQPEAAGEALRVIQRASAEVLEELASMLAVLRDDVEHAELVPAPGLGDVGRLIGSLRPSGLAVQLRTTAMTDAVASALSTAAYRVVQESLTNVLRHSQARLAEVSIDQSQGGLCVEVEDPGPARDRDTSSTGVGLRGMRERVEATGGSFTAGPTLAGGFAVHAMWGGDAG